jgi:hypothetical protein
VVLVTYVDRIGSQKVEVVEVCVPETVAVAVNTAWTHSA